MRRRLLRSTSILVLVCFVASLAAPFVEARGSVVVPIKVPGQQVIFDLNTASAGLLQRLPGIGKVTAESIG
ncbi:MAG: helix-hairpin-helix domain-containing protein, partial [Candidatus Riflebacteria bacterium]|nr:helix-hairpin-helix domain-containing protein [Candidatus Riflebacteria bacterium]